MYVPYITPRIQTIERRKGGGHGGGGRGSGARGRGSRGGSDGGHDGESIAMPNLLGGKTSATAYGDGGGKAVTIASGPFRGRSAGGGSRAQVYGTGVYGSGYPGSPSSAYNVSDADFPFYFYPIVWSNSSSSAGAAPVRAGSSDYPAFLRAGGVYGLPDEPSRPGGPLMYASFQSNTTGTTFRVLGDNSTVVALTAILRANCSVHGNLDNGTSSAAPTAYTGSAPGGPFPEQAVQYFRASSLVLTLDGYNNTAVFTGNPNASAAALPAGIDGTLLSCLNYTIGLAAPLVSPPTRQSLDIVAITGIVCFALLGLFAIFCAIAKGYLYYYTRR